LTLRINVESPSETLVHEHCIFNRELVSWKAIHLPLSGKGWTSHKVVELEALGEWNVLVLNHRHPARDEVISVLRREWAAVTHEGSSKDTVSDKFLVLVVQEDEGGLPTGLLAGKSGDELVTSVNMTWMSSS
jgi:hypothetical protein